MRRPCLSLHEKCLAGVLAFCVAAQGHAARRRLSVRYMEANHTEATIIERVLREELQCSPSA